MEQESTIRLFKINKIKRRNTKIKESTSYLAFAESAIRILDLEKVNTWEPGQVLRTLANNLSWMGDYLFIRGFESLQVKGMTEDELTEDLTVHYFKLSQLKSWIDLGIWLKDYAFNKEELNLCIEKVKLWNLGDKGGIWVLSLYL